MDPNTAYRMMTEHLIAGDYNEAYDMAVSLLDWIGKGGFLPYLPNASTLIPLRRQVVAKCEQAIDLASRHIEV